MSGIKRLVEVKTSNKGKSQITNNDLLKKRKC